MDWHYMLAIIAGLLAIISVAPYIRDMVRGTTRPNIVSWGIWGLVQAIFAAAQFAEGASLSIVLPIAEVAAVGAVVALGLFGYGYKKYGRLDFICLGLALGAIVLWQVTNEPLVAMWMAVLADLIAAIPTLLKAYKDPTSETPSAYFLVVLSALAAGFSSSVLDLPNLLWPVYIALLNGSILGLILLGVRAKKRPR